MSSLHLIIFIIISLVQASKCDDVYSFTGKSRVHYSPRHHHSLNHHHSKALKSKADLVVAKDGTGNFKTVKEAVAAAPENSKKRFVIYVKKGIYDEIVNIGTKKTNLTIVGDGQDSTILTGNLNAKNGVKTFDSATLGVDGGGFLAQDLCVQNTAGPVMGQAVALRVSATMVVIYRCKIDAYQDTLYAHSGMQFYRECHITGTVDFICGHATAVFQYCLIEPRKSLKGQQNMVTAQSRNDTGEYSAFSFQKCNVIASPDLTPVKGTIQTFLGRPWGWFSTVVFMQSYIDNVIDSEGWAPWNKTDKIHLSTLYYGEYDNRGSGSYTGKRVNWPGFKKITNPAEANKFTLGTLFGNVFWINSTAVPYDKDL